MTANENLAKTAASESAAALVTDGMLVGLGSGTTAAFAVAALGRRVFFSERELGQGDRVDADHPRELCEREIEVGDGE